MLGIYPNRRLRRGSAAALFVAALIYLVGAVGEPLFHSHLPGQLGATASSESSLPAPSSGDSACSFCHAFSSPALPLAAQLQPAPAPLPAEPSLRPPHEPPVSFPHTSAPARAPPLG